MSGFAEIQRARTEARLARLKLERDALLLKDRLSPGHAMAELRDRARDRAAMLGDQAVHAVRRKPAMVGGIVAILAGLAAIGPLRRAARHAGCAIWRNRGAIGRFIKTNRASRKDQRP